MDRHFWFIDDEHQTRWAVRLSQPFRLQGNIPDHATRIVFTSTEQQISTVFPFQKDEGELTQYELIELLAIAKRDSLGAAQGAAA